MGRRTHYELSGNDPLRCDPAYPAPMTSLQLDEIVGILKYGPEVSIMESWKVNDLTNTIATQPDFRARLLVCLGDGGDDGVRAVRAFIRSWMDERGLA